MLPVEFDVSVVSKKVYMGYCRYAGWNRAKGIWGFLIPGLIFLGMCGMFLFKNPDAWDTGIVVMLGLSGIIHVALALGTPNRIFNTWKHTLGQRWHYAFGEHAAEAAMAGGVSMRWEYYALAYAREAKDAFYLVLESQANQAMVIPKDALTPEQCEALAEVLQRGMPGGKFTRWKGAGD